MLVDRAFSTNVLCSNNLQTSASQFRLITVFLKYRYNSYVPGDFKFLGNTRWFTSVAVAVTNSTPLVLILQLSLSPLSEVPSFKIVPPALSSLFQFYCS